MISIEDPGLPGLQDFGSERIRALTGGHDLRLLRLRYRPGRRAILHVASAEAPCAEGTLWFFGGDKGRRIARRNKGARFDPVSGAVFERFPQDHRLPEIRRFLDDYAHCAAELIGGAPDGLPRLLRYRPGLSATFLCPRRDGTRRYAKVLGDTDPLAVAKLNRELQGQLDGPDLKIARCCGLNTDLRVVVYEEAPGQPLDAALRTADPVRTIDLALSALAGLWRTRIAPARRMDAAALLTRGAEAAALVSVTTPGAAPCTDALLGRLSARLPDPDAPLCPIHGDIKLEHLFLDGTTVTLIDTESLSLGPPDYDLAQLAGRLIHARTLGEMEPARANAAIAQVRRAAGPDFDWHLGIVALRLAKFHAQRPGPDATGIIATLLEQR